MADCLWNQRHLRVLPGSPGTLFVVTARAVWRTDVASGTVAVVSRYEGGGRSATTCVRLGRATVVVACFDGMLRWISADGTHGAFGAGIDGPTSVAAAGDDVFVQAASGLHRVSLRTEKGRRVGMRLPGELSAATAGSLVSTTSSREVMLADVTAAAVGAARRVWSYGAHREVAAWGRYVVVCAERGGLTCVDVVTADSIRLPVPGFAGELVVPVVATGELFACRRACALRRTPPRLCSVRATGLFARPRWFHPTRAQLAWLSRSDRTLVRDLLLLRRRLCVKAGLPPLPPELWTLVRGFVLAGDRGGGGGAAAFV